MKNRYIKLFLVLFVVIVLVYTVADHNYSWYNQTIGTIVEVENSYVETRIGPNDEEEKYFNQRMIVEIKNGSQKGQQVLLNNAFSQSQINTTEYRKGSDLFLKTTLENDRVGNAAITGEKRDKYLAVVLTVFILLLIYIAKGLGVMTLISLGINITIFGLAIKSYVDEGNLIRISIAMLVAFVVSTLIILGGFTTKSIGAVLSTLISIAVVIVVYAVFNKYSSNLPYETIEYITGGDKVESLVVIGTVMGCLGAVMDVAITMHASIFELVEQTPGITVKALRNSAKEIGDDIMGTMISVLFFAFLSGSIPSTLIEIKNGFSIITLIRYYLTFDIIRFLIGSIGIVMTIPIATWIAIGLEYRKLVKAR